MTSLGLTLHRFCGAPLGALTKKQTNKQTNKRKTRRENSKKKKQKKKRTSKSIINRQNNSQALAPINIPIKEKTQSATTDLTPCQMESTQIHKNG